MPPLNLQYWWCGGKSGCGHIIGHVGYKDLQNGGRVKALFIYEHSLDTAPTEVQPLRGSVVSCYDFRCTKCANQYDWYPSLEALNRLIARYQVSALDSGKVNY